MQYLLIETDLEKFFRGEVNSDEFDQALKKAVGDSKLEEVEPSQGLIYEFFVEVNPNQTKALVPRLMGVKGVKSVLVFKTKPMSE